MSKINGQSADEDLFYQLRNVQIEFDLSNSDVLEVIGLLLQRWSRYIQTNGVGWNELNWSEVVSIRGKTVEIIEHNVSFDFSRTIVWKNSDGSIFHTYTFYPIRITEQELFQTLVAIREELMWKL